MQDITAGVAGCAGRRLRQGVGAWETPESDQKWDWVSVAAWEASHFDGPPVSSEVLVIGGGPSGLSCATRLASRGHDVAVLEQSAYPRRKPCGDGLTAGSLAELQRLGLGSVIETFHSFDGLKAIWREKAWTFRLRGSQPGVAAGATVPRRTLHLLIGQHARDGGVKVITDAQVTGISHATPGTIDQVEVRFNGRTENLRPNRVVIASGAAGRN